MTDTNLVAPANPEPSYRRISGVAESQEAIDQVIATVRTTLKLFDVSLTGRGFNSPARIEALKQFLVAGRVHRLLIALHEPETVERDCPRLVNLLRQFPLAIEIHRTLDEARKAMDPFLVADDHSVWHQLHVQQPRAIVALNSPPDATPIAQRFADIWELSEPAVSATTPGL